MLLFQTEAVSWLGLCIHTPPQHKMSHHCWELITSLHFLPYCSERVVWFQSCSGFKVIKWLLSEYVVTDSVRTVFCSIACSSSVCCTGRVFERLQKPKKHFACGWHVVNEQQLLLAFFFFLCRLFWVFVCVALPFDWLDEQISVEWLTDALVCCCLQCH